MARLDPDVLARAEALADRVLDVAEVLRREDRFARVIGQLVGSGTSIGANVWEADEAMSRADFVKCLCIAVKELNETRYWLRLVGRRGWIAAERLSGLESDLIGFKRVPGTMIARTKNPSARPATPESDPI